MKSIFFVITNDCVEKRQKTGYIGPSSSPGIFISCYTESVANPALPIVLPYLMNSVSDCYNAARAAGYLYYGAQGANGYSQFQCAYGANTLQAIKQYGVAACGTGVDTQGYKVGTGLVNAVYALFGGAYLLFFYF